VIDDPISLPSMKSFLLTLLAVSLFSSAHAAVETWTSKSGKTAQLELTSASEVDGQKVGQFKTTAGTLAKIKASDLSEADAKRLNEWQPAPATSFDSYLEKDLVKLEGKPLKRIEKFVKPTKYYLFYYTASWCSYSREFAPDMLEFYQNHKDPRYEVILVSNDHDEKAMENFALEEKMPWPQVKFSKIEKFQKDINQPSDTIPNLVLTDAEGNLLKTSYVNGDYVGPTSILVHLDTLLKK